MQMMHRANGWSCTKTTTMASQIASKCMPIVCIADQRTHAQSTLFLRSVGKRTRMASGLSLFLSFLFFFTSFFLSFFSSLEFSSPSFTALASSLSFTALPSPHFALCHGHATAEF